ncbi:MAG TPA: phage holin family protein [Patescibacteria group bacterium]|jgi:putative membrane protein|nr:phage holin family protein [Patescibacteria group bacterium]
MLKKNPIVRFVIRWLVCSLGLWIAAAVLGGRISYNNELSAVIIAGFILAVINLILKPILVILSLPAVVLSLGLFMIIINGLLVLLACKLDHALHVTSFGVAILAGMIIGLVNYLVSAIIEGI